LLLSYHQIRNADFEFSSSCLPQLEILDLSDNFLKKIPIKWISQMRFLKVINLSKNYLNSIPNTMFYNISNIEYLYVASNYLTTFELWLMEVKNQIDYSNNPVTRFTNYYNVDLSNFQSNLSNTFRILFNSISTKIDFDDSVIEMYNRCGEITSTYTKSLMQAISIIDQTGLLRWRCSCEQYYLQQYIVSIVHGDDFSIWKCPNSTDTFRETCSNHSSFNVTNIKPRLCKINDSEPGHVPEYMEPELHNSVSGF